MEYYVENNRAKFPCGCEFDVIGFYKNGDPRIKFDPELRHRDHDINFTCDATFDLFCKGLTKGVFQLASKLGKRTVKNLKPSVIDDINALGSILRPGMTQLRDEHGVTATDHYCFQKNGEEPIHDVPTPISEILKKTYNHIIYQEQAMAISKVIAGFDPKQVNALRKSMGKKDTQLMSKMESLFIELAEKLGVVTLDEAKEVFRGIKASQRYLFCKAHSVGYGKTTYETAYAKTHFPLAEFLSLLTFSKYDKNPLKELAEIIADARLFNVAILPPDYHKMNKTFWSDRKDIYFGIVDIKDIGESQYKKLIALPKVTTWINFLLQSDGISSTMVDGLVRAGALRCFGVSRKRMLAEYKVFASLTKKEVAHLQLLRLEVDNPTFIFLLESLLTLPYGKSNYINSKRGEKIVSELKLLKNPASSMEDDHAWIVRSELELLGVVVSLGRIKESDAIKSNTTVTELIKGFKGYSIIAVEVMEVKLTTTKKGQNPGQSMAILTVEDNSGVVEVVAFPQVWEQVEPYVVTGNKLYMEVERTRTDSLSLKRVWTI